MRDQVHAVKTALASIEVGTKMILDRLDQAPLDPSDVGESCKSARSCRRAAASLRELLDLPHRRPDSWEASPVSSLEEPLREVVTVLDGGDDR